MSRLRTTVSRSAIPGCKWIPTRTCISPFSQEQSQVRFILTQWQGNGTADVIFKVLGGTTDIHDFNINIPKPSGGITNIVVQETSNASLIDTYTFDSATSTYTLYVGQTFNQLQADYNQAEAGNATFTINNITYSEKSTIPSTDLLFDVSAVDADGDSATTSLQVDLQGQHYRGDQPRVYGDFEQHGGWLAAAAPTRRPSFPALRPAPRLNCRRRPVTWIETSTPLHRYQCHDTPDAFTDCELADEGDHPDGTLPMTAAAA